MTAYKPRSAWTSSGRGGSRLSGTQLVGIAWHWPGTSQNVIGAESESATANRLRGYRNFHVGSRGWSDIGYNFAIDQAGRVWDLRGLGRVGAHSASSSNPDANHEWMGVLLILGDRERPSARMIRACQDFTHDVFLERWSGRTRETGHGRAPGVPGAQTSCPGPYAAELIVDGELTERPEMSGGTVSYNDVWRTDDKMRAPEGRDNGGKNPHWWPENILEHVGDFAAGDARFLSPFLRKQVREGKPARTRWLIEWAWHYAHGARAAAQQARNSARDNAKQIGELAAQVSALSSAVEQLSAGGIDLAAVQAAAEQGAAEAWRHAEVSVAFDDPNEPEDDSDDEPDDA